MDAKDLSKSGTFSILDPNQIISNPLFELRESLFELSALLQQMGYPIEPLSGYSWKRAQETPDHQIEAVTKQLKSWSHRILSHREIEAPNWTPLQREVSFAKEVLKDLGFTVDDEFWTTIEEDQVIEIYGPEMTQVYRSFNFFKYTGYSLLDITLNEWFILWERPKRILEMIQEQIHMVINLFVSVKNLPIPKHVLREVLNTGDTIPFIPRATCIEFKKIGSIRKIYEDRPCGLICTAVGTVIARGEEAENIALI